MLAVLMYHRVTNTPFESNIEAFEKHLLALAKQYTILLPGETLTKNKLNICLTFDDAYFDFYKFVFPLLQKLGLRAMLAVPAGLILDKTEICDEKRLKIPYADALRTYDTTASLCTWEEIKIMLKAGSIDVAAHGLTHIHLNKTPIPVEEELIKPKNLIKEKTGYEASTFVYPYGAMTRRLNKIVNQHYQYTMRIGSALNLNWKNFNQVIYRINAEEFWPKNSSLLQPKHQLKLSFRFLTNSLRFK